MRVSPPDVQDLLAYLALTGANYDPDTAGQALNVASAEIEALCVMDPFTWQLREAILRRASTILTSRGAPLGQLDTGGFGMSPLLRYDPELGKLLAGALRGPFA